MPPKDFYLIFRQFLAAKLRNTVVYLFRPRCAVRRFALPVIATNYSINQRSYIGGLTLFQFGTGSTAHRLRERDIRD